MVVYLYAAHDQIGKYSIDLLRLLFYFAQSNTHSYTANKQQLSLSLGQYKPVKNYFHASCHS